jgi:hypothetical protein
MMIDRSNPEFKPIQKDEKGKDRQYFCIGWGNTATQTANFKMEGATILERYCDKCTESFSRTFG